MTSSMPWCSRPTAGQSTDEQILERLVALNKERVSAVCGSRHPYRPPPATSSTNACAALVA
jgi:hypothetical protein